MLVYRFSKNTAIKADNIKTTERLARYVNQSLVTWLTTNRA